MFATIFLVTAGVFVLDVAIPLGHIIWLLNLLPLWLSSRLGSSTAPVRYASLCTILLGAGFWLAPPGADLRTAIFNRILGAALLWGAAYLLAQRFEAEAALRSANSSLELRVAEQTQDLVAVNDRLTRQLTEQREVETVLRESRERFELAAEGADVGVWEWDLATGSAYYSLLWKSQIGCTESDIVPTDGRKHRGGPRQASWRTGPARLAFGRQWRARSDTTAVGLPAEVLTEGPDGRRRDRGKATQQQLANATGN